MFGRAGRTFRRIPGIGILRNSALKNSQLCGFGTDTFARRATLEDYEKTFRGFEEGRGDVSAYFADFFGRRILVGRGDRVTDISGFHTVVDNSGIVKKGAVEKFLNMINIDKCT